MIIHKERFPVLIREHESLMHRIISKYCNNRDDARDLVATIWSKTYASYSRLEKEEDFPKWLATIARNACIDYLRKKGRSVYFETNTEQDIAVTDTTAEAHASLSKSDTLQEALDMLCTEDRLIIILHHIRGESVEAISRKLGPSRAAIKVKLFRAREKLRNALLKTKGDGL